MIKMAYMYSWDLNYYLEEFKKHSVEPTQQTHYYVLQYYRNFKKI
jgi:hypothetical protein